MSKSKSNPIKPGVVLISEPFLGDQNFSRAVVLIVEHGEEGTVGFVLNQRTDIEVGKAVPELASVSNVLFQGGPVELESFHYLHAYGEIEGSVEVLPGVHWSGDFSQVQDGISNGTMEQTMFKFFVAYSGWAPGQLAAELEDKSWVIGTLESEYVLSDQTKDADLWKHAMKRAGGRNVLLANSPDAPYLN